MSRWIDADALVIDYYDDVETEDDVYTYAYVSKVQIDSAPTIDVAIKWIPCEERLPKPYTEVLVCDECGWISLGVYRPCDVTEKDSGWSTLTRIKLPTDEVLAWMPLPKPYGERKESE